MLSTRITTAIGRKNSATRPAGVDVVPGEPAHRSLVARRQIALVTAGQRLALPGHVGTARLALGRWAASLRFAGAVRAGSGAGICASLRFGVGRPLGACGSRGCWGWSAVTCGGRGLLILRTASEHNTQGYVLAAGPRSDGHDPATAPRPWSPDRRRLHRSATSRRSSGLPTPCAGGPGAPIVLQEERIRRANSAVMEPGPVLWGL